MNRFEIFPKLINDMKLKIMVELGVECAKFSRYMIENSNIEHIYHIDLWTPDAGTEPRLIANFEESCDRTIARTVMKHPARCSIIKYDTADASKFFIDDSVDFVFIDADNTYFGAKRNFDAWYPKIRAGGIIAIHNYNQKYEWMGTRQLIHEVAKKYNMPFELTTERYNTAFFLKKKEFDRILKLSFDLDHVNPSIMIDTAKRGKTDRRQRIQKWNSLLYD